MIRKTQETAGVAEGCWLKQECLKRGTEALIMHAQEQAIGTNAVKVKINKIQRNSKSGCVEKLMRLVNEASWLRTNIRHD